MGITILSSQLESVLYHYTSSSNLMSCLTYLFLNNMWSSLIHNRIRENIYNLYL